MTGEEWEVSDILESEEPEQIIKRIKKKVEDFKTQRENLDKAITADRLKDILLLRQQIHRDFKKLNAYYRLKFSENTDDSEAIARISHLEQFSTEMSNEMLFFNLWFMDLEEDKAEKLMSHEELEDHKYYLEQIRKDKPFTKTEEVEQIISLKSTTGGDAFGSLYNILTSGFEFQFEGEEGLNQEEVTKHYRSEDPEKRKEAYQTVLNKYETYGTILKEIYNNIVMDWYNEGVKIRGYDNPISVRNHGNDIEDETVETMLEVIRENMDVFQEFFQLHHEVLKEEQDIEYSRYHVYAPYKVDKEYPYEESKEIVLNLYKEFDERFYEAAKEIFDKDHVHSHPKKHKRGGAFSYSVHNEATPYIMLNHTDGLKDLFTMVHEFGHGIHGVLSREQVDLLYHTAVPMAETASVFSEMLLASKMLEESKDEEEKKALLIYLLSNQYASIGRQAYFTMFEQEAHENMKEGLTKEHLNEMWMDTLREQFGEMEIPEEFKHEWSYIPHLFRTPFYCYGYVWGNLVVLSLYQMYKEQRQEFVDDYIEMLSQGGGKKPADLLAMVDIDPTDKEFWQKGFDLIEAEIEELKELI